MISARDLIGEAALSRYDDNGDPLLLPRERVLLALRWHDWISPSDLYDQLDLGIGTVERDTHMKALERLIKSGIVERQIFRHASEARASRGQTHLVDGVFVRLSPNVAKPRSRARA